MNLSGDQETFVKMSAQALAEWWASLGAMAWVLLGALLVVGLVGLVGIMRRITRGDIYKAAPPPEGSAADYR